MRAQPICYLYAVLAPILVLFIAAFANLLTGGSNIQFPKFWYWVWSVLINLPFTGLWEELGWRGFLLPRLQLTRSSFLASLLVGLTWGPWHAPLQAQAYKDLPDVNPFLGFLIFCSFILGLSVILTWLYNKAGGALFPCIVFHTVLNNTSSYFIEMAVHSDGLRPMLWAAGATWLTAISLLFWTGRDLGLIKGASTEKLS